MKNNLSYVYAVTLDILGYKYHLDADRKSGSLDFKNSLNRAMDVFSNINEADFYYQAISDTLIITCADRDKFLKFIKTLKTVFLAFLEEGLFVRGGIAYATHFKSSHVTYSPALALAHNLEDTVAIYPRIVIDQNIIAMFRESKEIIDILKSGLICSHNKIYFINIINQKNWNNIYKFAHALYEKEKTYLEQKEDVISKHIWFENYLFQSDYRDKKKGRYIPQILILKRKRDI